MKSKNRNMLYNISLVLLIISLISFTIIDVTAIMINNDILKLIAIIIIMFPFPISLLGLCHFYDEE